MPSSAVSGSASEKESLVLNATRDTSDDKSTTRISELFAASLHAFHQPRKSEGGEIEDDYEIDFSNAGGPGGSSTTFFSSTNSSSSTSSTFSPRASESNEPGPNSFKLYRARWTMLGIFCAFSATNAMEWLSYSPVSSIFALYFDVSLFAINLLSLVFMLVYVLLAAWAGAFLKEKGLRYSLCLGASLNMTGALLKLLPWPFAYGYTDGGSIGYFFAFAGTICCAIAQLFTLAAPVLVAQNWFGSHERVTATAIGATANGLGGAISFALVPLVLGSHGSAFSHSAELAQTVPVQYLLLAQLILVSAAGALVILYFKEHPPTPPSYSAAAAFSPHMSANNISPDEFLDSPRNTTAGTNEDTTSSFRSSPLSFLSYVPHGAPFLQTIELAMHDPAFSLVILTFGIQSGFGYALVVLLSSLLSAAHYSSGFISACGIVAIVCGLFSTLGYGILADQHAWRAQKKNMVWGALGVATASMALFTFIPILPAHFNFYVITVMVILGLALNAPEALLMDLAVENTYPAPAEVICQFLIVVGNIVGIVLILLLSLLQDFSTTFASFCSVLVLAFPTYAWSSYQGQHKRFDSEIAAQRQNDLQVGFTPAGLVTVQATTAGAAVVVAPNGKLQSYQSEDPTEENRLL